MSISALIRNMAAAGATPEAIALAVEAIEAVQRKDSERRAKNAERKARQRARERDSHATVTGQSPDTPPSPDKEKCPKEINPTHPCVVSSPAREAFDRFWSIYPHKVGKRDALKAFERATTRAPLEKIFDGLLAYVAKTDDRPWCNPATWLNQDRWDDEPAAVTPQARGSPPPRHETDLQRISRQMREREHDQRRADFDIDGEIVSSFPGEWQGRC